MNKADLLMAGLRQLAAGKTVPRMGIQSATVAKDGKDKAEHFREQLRLIAQGTKHERNPPSKAPRKTRRKARKSRITLRKLRTRYRPGRKAARSSRTTFLQIRLPRKRRRCLRIGVVRKPL